MKWRNLVLIVLLVPVLLYGATRGYLWYSISSTVDQIQSRVGGFATLDYDEIRSPILGPIGVTGVTYTPHGFNEQVTIGSVFVHWNEPRELLDLVQAFHKNTLPKQLRVSINQVKVPLSGDIAGWLDANRQLNLNLPFQLPASLRGCGEGSFNSVDFREMGYDFLRTNLRFEYGLNDRSKNFSFYATMRNQEMMTLYVEGSAPSGGVSLSLNTLFNNVPKLSNVSVTYEDDSYVTRKVAFCSKKSNKSEKEYIESHTEQVIADLSKAQFFPSKELIDAYQSHLIEPSKFTITLNPYEPMDSTVFTKVDQGNFVQWLGLEVMANEKPIKELVASEAPKIAAEEQARKPTQKEETFNSTPIFKLPEHIGQFARVRTKEGKFHYAYLEKAGANQLTLTQHLVGGSATFVINVTDIDDVSVLY